MSEKQEQVFAVYKRFDSIEIAKILTDLLEENSIPFKVQNDQLSAPDIIVGDVGSNVEVLLKPEDFETVDALVEEKANQELDMVDKDYFIFEFSDEELIEVLVRPRDWSPLDVALAHKILNERGKSPSDAELADLRQAEIDKSAQPKDVKGSTIALLYACVILIPLVPMIGGLWYMMSTKQDLAGNSVKSFSPNSRKHGAILAILGFVFTVIAIMARVYLYD